MTGHELLNVVLNCKLSDALARAMRGPWPDDAFLEPTVHLRSAALTPFAFLLALLLIANSAPCRAEGGLLITPEAFEAAPLPRNFQNDKLRDTLGYQDDGPVRAFELDLDGDGKPERFIVGALQRCSQAGCPFALTDGRTQKDIGTFFGSLIVLDRKENGWMVIQTLGKRDETGLSNVTTYTFQRVQYQPDDSALLDDAGLDNVFQDLRRRP